MLTRRSFSLVLLTPLAGRALGAKGKAELWSGTQLAKAEKGAVFMSKAHVRLRHRVKPIETTMLSVSNDNQSFSLWVVMPRQPEGDFQYIKLDNEWWSSNGSGYDSEGSKTSFEFDRATALRIAGGFGIKVHERTKLDDGISYSWRFPPKLTSSMPAPIPIVLRVDNTGKTTVGFHIGGRQRGPRDNSFSFVIHRNGKPMKIHVAHDFGGLSYYKEIKPGEHAEVTCADLRAWADFDLPGYYTIEAKYEGQLAKDGQMPNTAAERANLWDVVPMGQGTILVQ